MSGETHHEYLRTHMVMCARGAVLVCSGGSLSVLVALSVLGGQDPESDVTFEQLAGETDGYSGADIVQVTLTA